VIPLVITGFGFAALFIPLTTVALSHTPRPQLADAAGLSSFVRQIGGSIGLTIFATLLGNYSKAADAGVGAHVSLLRPELANIVASSEVVLRGLAGRVARQGAVLAYEKIFLLQAVTFIVVLPLLFFLRQPKNAQTQHVEMTVE